MAELLAYLARELVDDPDAVRVESEERDGASCSCCTSLPTTSAR